jgi:hypothetical protein
MMLDGMPRPLFWTALGHALLAVGCVIALRVSAPPIMGVHPALKPLKFAVSIAAFLATMGILLPRLSIGATTRELCAWVLASTMVVEMLPIAVQAARGTTSHFNVGAPLDAAVWNLMVAAIVLASAAMGWVAVVATLRPLTAPDGQSMPPLLALAWRAGLWLLALSPVSGFAMGSRLRHSVGGEDGLAGLPFVNWSILHGDLRVAHFFALHAVQVLPLLAWGLLGVALSARVRVAILIAAIGTLGLLCVGTLVQALAGRPFVEERRPPPPS